ncbi:MAG: SpoVR family protein [Gemmatimonadota bacterium]|nr:SpoVR family protein [Gemmatimonadota bacterium]
MATSWTIDELQRWDEHIREQAEAFGLVLRPQEFEICDREQMLGYMAYSGMPSHYPHWSYGKRYERMKTLHDYGVTGLPYEMVINSHPALAYLMRDNTLAQQVLTMAHVYGHNDFFENNFNFEPTRPDLTLGRFKVRADRIRRYVEDPSIGLERVEQVLDAAHALSLQVQRNPAIQKLSREEQEERALARARPRKEPHHEIRTPDEPVEVDLHRTPLEPESDLLLFIRDHNPYLAEWERDVLTIVHDQARYFVPQIETKIMNEGWATYWHHRILNALALPEDLHMEFLVHHSQVIRTQKGDINPYHLGFVLWHDIRRRAAGEEGRPGEVDVQRLLEAGDEPLPGEEELFEIREVDRDVSFLRRFLTWDVMRELDLFEYEEEDEDLVVSRVSDADEWTRVKETLLRQVGMGSVPDIRVHDADMDRNRVLLLRHHHDGRDLDLGYAEQTLRHIHRLWGRTVVLETRMGEEAEKAVLSYDEEEGFEVA